MLSHIHVTVSPNNCDCLKLTWSKLTPVIVFKDVF